MAKVIVSALGFAFVIVAAFVARSRGVLSADAGRVLSEAMVCLTLPMAIVTSLNGAQVAVSDLYLVLMGIGLNALALLAAHLMGRRRGDSAALMTGAAGFNVGNFALPFLSNVLGRSAVVTASVFDVGNSVMCLGVNGAVIEHEASADGTRLTVRDALGTIVHSIPAMTYLTMITLCLLGLRLPQVVVDFASVGAAANPFVAMATIGASIDVACWDRGRMGAALRIVGARLVASLAQMAIVLLLPLPMSVKCVVCVLCLSPVASMGMVYAIRYDLDQTALAVANTIYVPLSLVTMSLCVILLG